jgi:hypothetical protein
MVNRQKVTPIGNMNAIEYALFDNIEEIDKTNPIGNNKKLDVPNNINFISPFIFDIPNKESFVLFKSLLEGTYNL